MKTVAERVANIRIHPRYEMVSSEMRELYESPSQWDCMISSFELGYLKGQRALKAQQKKKRNKKTTV